MTLLEIISVTILTNCVAMSSSASMVPPLVPFYDLPGLPRATYSQLGDINIGVLLNLRETSGDGRSDTCSKAFRKRSGTLEGTEAIAYAVGLVNQNPRLLPNVTLGFVIEGYCSMPGISLGMSLNFLPRFKFEQPCEDSSGACSSTDKESLPSNTTSWLSHDVIGVVSPGSSSLAAPISHLYAVGQVPLIGAVETSNELSSKLYHPFFFRIVPSDDYQVRAILKFISSNGWSYISVVYHAGDYGERAFDTLQRSIGAYGICIATSHKLVPPMEYDVLVADLFKNSRARVVVLITFVTYFRRILQAVADKNATGHFIWIGFDALSPYAGYKYEGLKFDPAVGTIIFEPYTIYVSGFYDHLKRQNVSTTKNPFLKPTWEWLFDCSLAEGTCDPDIPAIDSPKFYADPGNNRRIDVVMTFAQAAHDLLTERCPDARGADARDCITGPLLKEYLKKTTLDGFSGRIKFDEKQENKGRYAIKQMFYDYFRYPFSSNTTGLGKKRIIGETIQIYDSEMDALTNSDKLVTWSHLDTLERIVPWTENSLPIEIPESVCSRPCVAGEYKIEKDVPCCWDCVRCRDNEYLVRGNTSCEACPPFMWPDPSTAFTACSDIPLTYPSFQNQDIIPVVFTSLATLALAVTTSVSAAYFKFRNERVIKASSKELSVIQLVAIFIGYATIILFQTKPTDTMCGVLFFSFSMSFALLYCPLLVKTVRIFRIFKGGEKNERPKFISPQSQLILSASFIAIQVSLCVATYILYWPGARRTQPIWTEKFVELSCDLTLPGIASFLGYNIVLVSLCSVFAFKVRKLPDNFNESKFISMCVSTTLLIWLAFIPTYFTADREFVRTFLLSMALFLNHSVALLFLFLPKIYAVKFLPPEQSEFSNKRT